MRKCATSFLLTVRPCQSHLFGESLWYSLIHLLKYCIRLWVPDTGQLMLDSICITYVSKVKFELTSIVIDNVWAMCLSTKLGPVDYCTYCGWCFIKVGHVCVHVALVPLCTLGNILQVGLRYWHFNNLKPTGWWVDSNTHKIKLCTTLAFEGVWSNEIHT
jgi:hypothetical protein